MDVDPGSFDLREIFFRRAAGKVNNARVFRHVR